MLLGLVPNQVEGFEPPLRLSAIGEVDKARAFGAEHVQTQAQHSRLSLAVHGSTQAVNNGTQHSDSTIFISVVSFTTEPTLPPGHMVMD